MDRGGGGVTILLYSFSALAFSLSVFGVVSFLIKLSAVVNWAILRSEYRLIMFRIFVLVAWGMRLLLLL